MSKIAFRLKKKTLNISLPKQKSAKEKQCTEKKVKMASNVKKKKKKKIKKDCSWQIWNV